MSSKKLWFKAKNYGWGWYPITWQGWLIVLAFVALQIGNFYRIDHFSHSISDTVISFVAQSVVLTSVLIYICYKTGEPPRWRWGK